MLSQEPRHNVIPSARIEIEPVQWSWNLLDVIETKLVHAILRNNASALGVSNVNIQLVICTNHLAVSRRSVTRLDSSVVIHE